MKTNRDFWFTTRLTREERAALELLSTREGRTGSEMIRELIRRELDRQGFTAIGAVRLVGPFLDAPNDR